MVRRVLVGGMLVAASVPSLGLTLGSVQGQAHFGQPLNLRVPLTLADGESADSLCPVVRVFFADDPLPPATVAVSVTPGGSAASAVLNIVTRSALTEPFGRVDVVVGCNNQISRQYTLLTELPAVDRPLPLLPQTPVAAAIQTQRASSSNQGQAPSAGVRSEGALSVDAPVQQPAGAAGAGVKVLPRPVVRTTDASSTAPAASRPRAPQHVPPPTELTLPGSRLKLDPVELVAAVTSWSPLLRMTVDLPFAPSDAETVSDDLAQRRDTARALWRALNDPPEQSAAATLKAEALAVEAERLRAELAASKQMGADLQVQLQQEHDSLLRQPVVLVVGGALLLMAAAAIAVLLRRRSGADQTAASPWWKRSGVAEAGADKKPSLMERGKSTLRTRSRREATAAAVGQDVDIDVDTLFPSDAAQALKAGATENRVSVSRVDPVGHPHADFLPSALMDGARSVATEELFDLQQQVEFFISLGQSDQAIDVLVNHLAESQEPSPLAYLDLLKLYHELDRRDDYESLRADFNRQFSGGAPAFDEYSYSRRGLERYESALSRIQALWPQPEVLALIERSIFRQGPADVADVFDLEAYRELLLLYGIAREVIGRDQQQIPDGDATRAPDFLQSDAGTTRPQPLQARTPEVRKREEERLQAGLADFKSTEIDDSTERVFLDSGLDLDLSEPNDAELSSTVPVSRKASVSDGERGSDLSLDSQVAVPSTNNQATSDEPSFDLPEVTVHRDFGDSRFPVKQASSGSVKTVSAAGSVDFDFSDLASLEQMTLKKSGDHTP